MNEVVSPLISEWRQNHNSVMAPASRPTKPIKLPACFVLDEPEAALVVDDVGDRLVFVLLIPAPALIVAVMFPDVEAACAAHTFGSWPAGQQEPLARQNEEAGQAHVELQQICPRVGL